jgi:translocation and assembly module TamB
MTKLIKRCFIGLGIVFGLLFLLLIVACFYVQTRHAQHFIQGKINAAIPGVISWEGFRFSLLKGDFEFEKVLLKGASGDELAGIGHLSIGLSWTRLLKRELNVAELRLQQPWAALRKDSNGILNLTGALVYPKGDGAEPEKELRGRKTRGSSIEIVVGSLAFVGGSVSYEMVARDLKVQAQEIDLMGYGNILRRSGSLGLRIGKGRLENPGIQADFDQLKLEATLKKGRVDPLFFQVGTSSSTLSLSGSLRDIFAKPLLDVNLEISAALPEIRRLLDLEQALTGRVAAHVRGRGPVDNPEVDLRLDYDGGMLAGTRVDEIGLDCQLRDRFLIVTNMLAHLYSGSLNLRGHIDFRKVFADGYFAPQRDLEAISYEFLLQQQGLSLENMPGTAARELTGTVGATLSLSGRGISPQYISVNTALDLVAQNLKVHQMGTPLDLYVKTKANLEGTVATLEQLEAISGDITLKSAGCYDLLSQRIIGQLTMDAPSLARMQLASGLGNADGTFALKATFAGPIKRPVFDLDIKADRLRLGEVTIGNVEVNAGLDQSGMVRISKLGLENQGSLIQGQGWIKLFKDSFAVDPSPALNFSAVLRHFELRDFVEKELAQGTVQGQVNLSGTTRALKATASIQGKNLAVETVRIGDVYTDLRFSEGRIDSKEVEVHNRNSVLRISGFAQVFEQENLHPLKDPLFKLNVQGDPVFVEDFVDNLRGRVSLAAALGGSALHPEGTVNLHGTNVDTGLQQFQEIRLVATLDGKRVWINPLQASVAPGELIEAKGWFSLEKDYEIALVSKGVSLHNIDTIREQEIADGTVVFTISGNGTLDNPRFTGEVALTKPRFKGKSFEDFQIHLDLHDQELRISGKLNFDINASFNLQTKLFSASLLFDETDLGPYFKIADQSQLSGTVSGRIEAGGNLEAVQHIRGYADLSKLDLFFKETEFIRSRNLRVSFKDEEFSIPGLRLLVLKEGLVELKGRGRVSGALALEAKGRIPAQALSVFLARLPDLAGDLSLQASINGTWSRPDMRAEIGIEQVSFTVPTLLQKLHAMNGKIRITPQTVVIDKIGGQLDAGRFEVAGTVGLKGLRPAEVQLTLNVDALPVQVPDTLDALLKAELQINGTPEESMVQGELVILEGTYYRDVNVSIFRVVGEKRREEALLPKEINVPFLKNMNLDISLKRRNPFLVDNNLAHLEISPDLRLSGTLTNPIITGRAGTDSGTVIYRNKRFVVKKGVIDFSNPYKTEPMLDIESEVQIRKWMVYLAISGPPDGLSFRLTSDPPEEDGDILSLLLVGRTTQELIEAEGGTNQSPAQMLAGLISTTFGEDIKKTTGLDILEVETQEQEDEQVSDTTRVTIGKELSRRMTVKYAVESKDGEMSQRAIAEYKLLGNILLSGFEDTSGMFGGELLFRLEFR